MPDLRRNTGPEGSRSYRDYRPSTTRDLKGLDKRRSEGRTPGGHRPLFLKTGIVTQAKGSAYLEQGNTKVVCAVYGPREIPRRSDFSITGVVATRFQFSPFSCLKRKTRSTAADEVEEKEISAAIKEAVEATICTHLYPKSQIDIFVTVLENDGAVLAASLTCAGLALVDASVHVFDVLLGISLSRVESQSLLDPSFAEEEAKVAEGRGESSLLTVGYQPSSEQLACIVQQGFVDPQNLQSDVKQLIKLSDEILPSIQSCLIASVKKKQARLETG